MAAGADMLHLACSDRRCVAHVVAVRERSRRNVGNDLGVAMRMGRKSRARLNVIFDHDTQRSEIVPDRIAVTREGERQVIIGPAKVLKNRVRCCGAGGG